MNILDKVITALAPVTAARRAAARMALAQIQYIETGQVRRYESARVDRRTAGWLTSGNSANAEIGPDLPRLRNRSRDLARNNAHGARAVAAAPLLGFGEGVIRTLEAYDVCT